MRLTFLYVCVLSCVHCAYDLLTCVNDVFMCVYDSLC